jgi:hypothetical protein
MVEENISFTPKEAEELEQLEEEQRRLIVQKQLQVIKAKNKALKEQIKGKGLLDLLLDRFGK